MEEKPELTREITDDNKPKRDEKGRILPGYTGNQKGRPIGAGVSITTEIKRQLEKIPFGGKSTYLQLIVKKILNKAIKEGDPMTIKQIWNYIDGMPKGTAQETSVISLTQNNVINISDEEFSKIVKLYADDTNRKENTGIEEDI